jgi:hypothetical protein
MFLANKRDARRARLNILFIEQEDDLRICSLQQNTTQTFKNSWVKKACPTTLIHHSQFQLRNSHSWFYNKDPTFSWFKQKYLGWVRWSGKRVAQILEWRKELTNPTRVLVHIITAKAAIFSSMIKAIISIFAMKTCTELSTELVRHSIGSRYC